MASDTFLKGTVAPNTDNKAETAKLLSRVVMSEPENINAWLQLADCLDNAEKKKECLAWVLKLEPGNRGGPRPVNQSISQ